MKILKNEVEEQSKKRKNVIKGIYITLSLVVFGLFMTFHSLIANISLNNLNASTANKSDVYYVKGDSLLKTSAKKVSNSEIVAVKGTKVTHKPSKKDTKYYYYVTIYPKENKGFYKSVFSGYILKRRLTTKKVNHSSNRNLSVSDKTHITRNALLLYKVNKYHNYELFKYHTENEEKRKSGYKLINDNRKIDKGKTYYFDCSALVSTIYKATFNIDFLRENGNLYRTYGFLEEVREKKIGDTTDNFYIVDKVSVKSKRKKLYTSRLQAGDLILGINRTPEDKTSPSMNHIMLYVGDGRIIDASGRNEKEKIRYINLTKYYTTVSKKKNYHYSKEIYVLRLSKDTRKNYSLRKLSFNDEYDTFSISTVRKK